MPDLPDPEVTAQEPPAASAPEATKAMEELPSALGTMEKLKEGFNKERADWETEKSALIKRAEKAEAALKAEAGG